MVQIPMTKDRLKHSELNLKEEKKQHPASNLCSSDMLLKFSTNAYQMMLVYVFGCASIIIDQKKSKDLEEQANYKNNS